MKNPPTIALEAMLDLSPLPALVKEAAAQSACFVQTQYRGFRRAPDNLGFYGFHELQKVQRLASGWIDI
jgi:hypothetical protein